MLDECHWWWFGSPENILTWCTHEYLIEAAKKQAFSGRTWKQNCEKVIYGLVSMMQLGCRCTLTYSLNNTLRGCMKRYDVLPAMWGQGTARKSSSKPGHLYQKYIEYIRSTPGYLYVKCIKYIRSSVNKVTTRWEGPQSLSYHKPSLGTEKRWASVCTMCIAHWCLIKFWQQSVIWRFATSVCWTPLAAFKPS